MARKATVRAWAMGAAGRGATTPRARVEIATDEAGGTLQTRMVGVLTLDGQRYDALTAGEKTAFGALTLANIITSLTATATQNSLKVLIEF